jgi:hypothetical protein
MQHFYDGQIRRYITQLVRMMSNFSYKDGDNDLKKIPVTYGDLTRQVASIIRDNSENKIPSAPRMALYITGLAIDRERTSDSSYINKLNIRERAYDAAGNEYLNKQGKNYTVERLMPSPYKLTVNVDIWSSNTDQKLQIMEQILMLFNPSLEIQTTDNYIDWTSLSVVYLNDITFSNRSIPVGVDSEIDIATLTFETPIYISPPVKVKRLGVITDIIHSIRDESRGTIELGMSPLQLTDIIDESYDVSLNVPLGYTNYQDYGLYVEENEVQIIDKNKVGTVTWTELLEAYPGEYNADISRLYLRSNFDGSTVTGTFAINPFDETKIIVNWDSDTKPSNTIISGPTGDKTTIDYIIDPTRYNPSTTKAAGTRYLILGDIGNASNTDGPDAWKNTDNSDFVANANDIIEWDGNRWVVVFDSNNITDITYTTNTNTGTQYRWDGTEWLESVDGEYSKGAWRLDLDG